MPAHYQIDETRGCVISTATGVLTSADLIEHHRRLRLDPRFRSDLNQLCLFLALDGMDVSTEAIRTVAAGNYFGAGARRALVVDSPHAFGLARMFQAYTDGSPDEIAIFDEVEAANRWLDANPHRTKTGPAEPTAGPA